MGKKSRQGKGSTTTTSSKKSKNTITKSQSSAIKLPLSLIPPVTKKLENELKSAFKVVALIPNAVYYAHNFFTESECKAWIDQAESKIQFEYVSHPATRFIAHRECGRIQDTNWDISEKIFERMQHFNMMEKIHPYIGIDSGYGSDTSSAYQPVTCNGNIRMYKYEKGMSFGRHVDGSDRIPQIKNGNTEITVLVYLSSCTGGATRFYLPRSKKDKGGIAFVPKAGAVLFHVHGDRCLEHEADPVLSGIKYVLRTDIVYGEV